MRFSVKAVVCREISLFKIDQFAISRHPGESQGPEIVKEIEKTGFRLSPE
jgi:hypothetical protein